MVYSREEMEGNPNVVCKEEGTKATEPDALLPLFLLACTPLTFSYLTLPFSWPRDAGAEIPASPMGSSPLPSRGSASGRLKSSIKTIPGVAVVRRAAPSPPRRRGSPQVSPYAGPGRPRVSSPSARARGRRRLGTVDHNLIRRPQLPDTPSVAPATDGRAPLVGRLNRQPARVAPGVGRPSADPPRTARIPARVYFFSSKILLLIRF
jgi:hypothetical protein